MQFQEALQAAEVKVHQLEEENQLLQNQLSSAVAPCFLT